MPVAGFFLACVAGASVTLAAVQDPAAAIGRTVTAVRFEIEGRPESLPTVTSLSRVRVGAPLRAEDLRATLARLDALGRFEDASVVGTMTPAGVEVVFRLVPRHPVTELQVVGDAGVAPEVLRQQILRRYGGVPATGRPQDVARTAVEALRDAGYLDARVSTSTVLTHDPDGAILRLEVAAGPLVPVVRTEVDVRGVNVLAPAQVVERLGTRPGVAYKRREIEAALTVLEDELHGRGFYEAQAVMQGERTAEGEVVTVTIDTGPRVDVVVEPAGVLPRSALETLIPIARLGSADEDLLEDSRKRIEARLKGEGYWRASAPFTRTILDDGARVVITFDVTRGPRFFVDHVAFPDDLALPVSDLAAVVDLKSGDIFDEARFEAGLVLVADAYRRRGYYDVEVRPAYEEVPGRGGADQVWVILHPTIVEGPRGTVDRVEFAFVGEHEVTEAALRAAMRTRTGEPYIEYDAALDEATLQRDYLDRGFRSAIVRVDRTFEREGQAVALVVSISEGPRVLIADVQVIGNRRISTRAILDELRLSPGDPAGAAAIAAAERRLGEMGVFRRATVRVDDTLPDDDRALVIVSVLEAPNTTIGYGGGVEARRSVRSAAGGGLEDYLAWSPRGFFEIGRRNLGGRNRSLSFFSRLSYNPRRVRPDVDPSQQESITEYRVTGTYRERRAFRSDLDLLVGITSEQGFRTNFDFIRNGANAEFLRPLATGINWAGRYSLDFTRLLNERIAPDDPDRPVIDRVFPQVRLSIVGTGLSWDRRDDPLASTRGTLVTADVEVASRSLGSEVGYVKSFFQGTAFRALDASARTVLALRGQLGVARGFLRTVEEVDDQGRVVTGPDGQPMLTTVQDLPASQRFFAGGGTTVRGFQTDRLGVPELINTDGLSLGGNGVVVLNAELRRAVCGCRSFLGSTLSTVAFADSGNVFARAHDIDLGRLRAAIGVGIRYNSPLGPLRFDVGVKASRQMAGRQLERRWEYHLSIGEAF